MRLAKFRAENFRSIRVASLDFAPLVTLIGANNSGKTNLVLALRLFFQSTAVAAQDFHGGLIDSPIVLDAEFVEIEEQETELLSPYLLDGRLEVRRSATMDVETGRTNWETCYRGREPKDPYLKRSLFEENKQRLTTIVSGKNLPDYFKGDTGRVSQASFLVGLQRYLRETAQTIEWDEPAWVPASQVWSALQPLLPRFHYVPPVRSLEEELGGRTLLANLLDDVVERIMTSSGRLASLRTELTRFRRLVTRRGTRDERLKEIKELERRLSEALAEGFPESRVELEFEPPEIGDFFAEGSRVLVDDGIRTEATVKGHGMQRELIIAILRVYAEFLVQAEGTQERGRIFAIEEPELFLHPQAQRRFLELLDRIATNDQVVVCTHSPIFVDVAEYQRIRLIEKSSVQEGTRVLQVTEELFPGDERANFRLAVAYNTDRSELFFARKVLLVEGESDKIAFSEIAAKLEIDLYQAGVSIVEVGGKGNLPHFMRVTGAFQIPYAVVYDIDPSSEDHAVANQKIEEAVTQSCSILSALDPNLDTVLGVTKSSVEKWGKPFAIHRHLTGLPPQDLPAQIVSLLRTLESGGHAT